MELEVETIDKIHFFEKAELLSLGWENAQNTKAWLFKDFVPKIIQE